MLRPAVPGAHSAELDALPSAPGTLFLGCHSSPRPALKLASALLAQKPQQVSAEHLALAVQGGLLMLHHRRKIFQGKAFRWLPKEFMDNLHQRWQTSEMMNPSFPTHPCVYTQSLLTDQCSRQLLPIRVNEHHEICLPSLH